MVGAAIGFVLVVFARQALSNASLNNEGGDLTRQNVVEAVGFAAIVLYTVAYGAGTAFRRLRRRRPV